MIQTKLEEISVVKDIQFIDMRPPLLLSVTFDHTELGELFIDSLKEEYAAALYSFYFTGLSVESRQFFVPYPLFNPLPQNAEELRGKITEWLHEKDWRFYLMKKDNVVIAVSLLKQYTSDRPKSGIAVAEQYQGKKLGKIMQTLVNEQARILGIKHLYITTAQDNAASQALHKATGFKETGNMVPHFVYRDGKKVKDRDEIEMVLDL